MTFLEILIVIAKCLIVALAATTLFAYFTLFERRVLARLQNRVGPNRAGYIPLPGGRKLFGGFLQPLADAIKLFLKEEVTPALADKWVYIISPAFAVIPSPCGRKLFGRVLQPPAEGVKLFLKEGVTPAIAD